MDIYSNVESLVKEKGMTISQLEKKAGIANGTIGKWRDGNNIPLITTLTKVAETLGVTVNRLLKEKQDAKSISE